MNEEINPAELVPAVEYMRGLPNIYPTEEKARTALNKRTKTGLASATVKVGSRLYIVPSRFRAWMASHIEG